MNMNPEFIKNLQNKISELDDKISDINKVINSIKIDEQMFLKSNKNITPSTSCKVSYDSKGLIISSNKLEPSDIPNLQIDKIDGLRNILDNKVDFNMIDRLTTNDMNKRNIDMNENSIVGCGTKVNYNENGNIVSTSDLTINDLPKLSIKDIDGLQERLDIIESNQNNCDNIIEKKRNINAGTFTKVTYDNTGSIICGSNLSMNDMPMEIINKINSIESKIPMLASQKTIDNISKIVNGKVDANKSITSGVYTKVKVDSNGLITNGDILTINDLPKLSIKDIDGLDVVLHDKATQSDIIQLNDTISSITNTMFRIGEITGIKNELNIKANNKDLLTLSTKVDSMQNLMNILSEKIPNELIIDQLKQIQDDISMLSGRISVIESKLHTYISK